MDDDQQFCLRWNNHQSTLISVFDTLLENGTLVDCTLAAEGKFLKAHKVVLSACSPYFAALLSQQYDKHPIFILKDVKFQELRAMMDYMYRGEVNISQDQLAALLKAAESLQIKGLSDNSRSSSAGTGAGSNAMNKPDNLVKPPPPVPAKVPSSAVAQAAGLTIENKRPRLAGIAAVAAAAAAADLVDTDASVASREGSTSPSRKRKKISMKRKSIESNNVLDNHEQLSNSSSHSTTHATNNITTSTTNVLPVTKKTDHESSKQQAEVERGGDSANESANTDGKGDGALPTGNNKDGGTHSELMIEPKNEYPDDDDDGNENVEDLTIEDDDMMDDIDQAGPSHGGEGSSSGYGNWNMDRSEDGVFMPGQDGGHQRDAQGAEDLSITKIAGLTWDQWNARLALPLVQTLREGAHPLLFAEFSSSSTESGNTGSKLLSMNKLKFENTCANNGGSTAAALAGAVAAATAAAGEQQANFSCPDCGRMYKLKSSLRNHQKWECGKEPQFQCPYCVYRAKQKMHIGRHMERMHKERFFKVESDKVVALDIGADGLTMNLNHTC